MRCGLLSVPVGFRQIIAEGPESSAAEALEIVKHTMAHPFKNDLRVELVVDAKIGDTWYEAK